MAEYSEVIPRITQHRARYFIIACLLPVFMIYLQATFPFDPLIKGQNLAVVAGVIGCVLVAILWVFYDSHHLLSKSTRIFMVVLLLIWFYQVIRIQLDGSTFNVTAFITPVIIVLIFLKPPASADVLMGLRLLMYGLLVISLVSLVFGHLSWAPDGFDVTDAGESRIPIVGDFFGWETRWGGPFGSVNYAAPIGGLLIVFGLSQTRSHQIPLVLGGVLILGLGQSRTALFAVLAGITVLVLWGERVSASRARIAIRFSTLGILGVLMIAYIAIADNNLNGRTIIWTDFLELLPENYVFGVGDSGINEFVNINSGTPGFIPHVHAHSVLLDGFVRFGLIMLILSLAIFALAFFLTSKAVPKFGPGPLAWVTFIFFAGLSETIHSWSYWSVYIVVLLSAALIPGIVSKKRELEHA